MNNKFKNGFLDILFFFLYHIFALAGSFLLMISIIYNVNLLSIDDLQKFFNEKSSTAITEKVEKPQIVALIKNFKGEVFVSQGDSSPRLVSAGEKLIEKSIIETKEKSTVLISFCENYSCQIRLGSNTKINIDDLMKTDSLDDNERSVFNIIKGIVSFAVTTKKNPLNIKFKSKGVTFGIRGTQFVIYSEEDNRTLLAVKEGKVEVENSYTNKRNMITESMAYVAFANGPEQISTNNNLIDLFNWDMEALDAPEPEIDQLVQMVGQSQSEVKNDSVVVNQAAEDLKMSLNSEIEMFKNHNREVSDRLANIDQYLKELEKNFREEKPKIDEDISCLIRSRLKCELYSENLLMHRGFPSTFGTPKLTQLIIDDLRLYIQEKEAEIAKNKKELEEIQILLANRNEILTSAQQDLEASKDPNQILLKLKENRLKGK